MIPPPAQRMMAERSGSTVTEVPSSHSIFLSHAAEVAGIIEQAASGVMAAAH
jgi:hypothetical protein